MKFLILTLCLSAFYLQGTHGGVTQNVELSVESIKESLEKELNELIEPIVTGTKKIENRYIAFKIRQTEIEAFSLWNLNYSACMEFGSTLENSTHLAYNISMTAYQIVMNVSNSFNALSSSCASWNPYEAVKCYITNIATIKDEIESVKPLIKKYETVVMKLAEVVEDQFFTCIGDEPQPKPTDKPTTVAPTSKSTDAPAPKSTDAPAPKSTDAPAPKSTDAPAPKSTDAPAPKSTDLPKTSKIVANSTPSVSTPTTKKPWWHFW